MAHVYLTRSDIKLGYSQGQLIVKDDDGDEGDRRLPFCNVDSINVFGNPQLSTQLVRECLSSAVPIGYYSDDGHYLGRAVSPEHADPFRQKKQVMLIDDAGFCLMWAKMAIEAKLRNSLALLLFFDDIYRFPDTELEGLRHSLRCLAGATSIDELMGHEGNAAKCYFGCYAKLFSDTEFSFDGRNSRPPKDPVNALLSYGYSILHRSIVGAIERHGLHPYFGFLHAIQRGHAALASDLIEDYRAFLVDKAVLSFVRSGVASPDDFSRADNGAVYMTRALMRSFTDYLSGEITQRSRFFSAYGDEFRYGFHAALDKKLVSVVGAIDAGDPLLYQPFYWEVDDE